MRLLKPLTKKNLSTLIMGLIAMGVVAWMVLVPRMYPLVIQSGETTHGFEVEFADTPEKQEKGLMFRKDLANDKGMLFVFPQEKELWFWMKNTLIPLDIIYINSQNTISFIHHNALPHDETPIPSNGLAIAVLEIPGGQAAQQGIHVGDKVKTPLLKGSNQ